MNFHWDTVPERAHFANLDKWRNYYQAAVFIIDTIVFAVGKASLRAVNSRPVNLVCAFELQR